MRLLLGSLTGVLVVLSVTGRYYRSIVLSLLLISVLAADDCRSARHWMQVILEYTSREYYIDSDASTAVAGAGAGAVAGAGAGAGAIPSEAAAVAGAGAGDDTSQSPGTLQMMPWGVYNAISPGMEKLASVMRGDAGTSSEQTTTDLTEELYATDSSLQGDDKKIDATKFNSMKLSYKRIVILLCRMKNLAPVAHDALMTALGNC